MSVDPVTLASWLPLFVAVPLIAAAVAVVAPWVWLRRLLMLATPLAVMVAGGLLLDFHLDHPAIAHNVGNFPGGVSIPFASDAFSALMLCVTGLVTTIACWFAIQVGEDRARFYGALALMLTGGVNGALLTGDLFNLFVFVEVMLLPSYALIALTGMWRRLSVGRMFVLVNLLTSTLLLVGVGLVYGVAGTVNLAALANAAEQDGRVAVAIGIVLLALSVKAGVFPLHTWLPRSYPDTSPAVMALFSALHTKVAVYALFRVYLTVFGDKDNVAWLVTAAMVITMLFGGFASTAQHTLRHTLAYQMMAGVGTILVVLALHGADRSAAIAVGIVYLIHHMVTMGALIMSAGAVEETYGTQRLSRLSGIMRRDGFVSMIFAFAALSLVGFPPFSGFWAKIGVVLNAAVVNNTLGYIIIIAIVVSGLAALIAMIKVWREVFWGKPMQLADDLRVGVQLALPGAVLIAVSFGMFLFAGEITTITQTAAESLLDTPAYVSAVLGDGEAIGVYSSE